LPVASNHIAPGRKLSFDTLARLLIAVQDVQTKRRITKKEAHFKFRVWRILNPFLLEDCFVENRDVAENRNPGFNPESSYSESALADEESLLLFTINDSLLTCCKLYPPSADLSIHTPPI
jgi:hypothetical protein